MPIGAALSEGGADRPKRMTHARRSRPPHVRGLCDEILKAEISKVHKNQLFCGWVCAAFARRRVLVADRRDGGHDLGSVTTALQVMVAGLPRAVRASIIWGRGGEMAQHAGFTAIAGIPVYVADPAWS